MTLVETLNNILSNIDFSSVLSLEVLACGLIFNKLDFSAIDTLASDFAWRGQWYNVSKVKRLAELSNYRSDQLDSITLQMLDNMDKIGNLPANYASQTYKYFKVDERCDLWLPKWAKEMGYRTDKWNADAIFQDLKKCYDVYNRPFYYADPTQNIVIPDSVDYVHLYSTAGQTLDCFMKIKAQGVEGALEYAIKTWDWINQNLWVGDHYKEKVAADIFGGDVNFHLIALRLNAESQLTNFERLITDINKKLLANRWNSPLWYNYAVRVFSDETITYLGYTINAFILLHTIYPLLATEMKTAFTSMLSTPTRAWEGLINYSGLYDPNTGKFRYFPWSTPFDPPTALGCILLLLQGIVPDTGSLAIPLIEEFRDDPLLMLIPRILNFNIQERKLTLPVFAGAISFQFGEKLATFDFESDGVWRITFSLDWSTVTAAEKIGDLPKDLKYVKVPAYPQPYNPLQQLLNLLVAFMVVFMVLSMITELTRSD